jgi:DNA-binding transcriptional LysR family regulator
MKTLDLDAVQAFVLVADLKSFTRAAEAMETTQSAVSLKVKRLEDGLGRRLLERTPRLVRLSSEGGLFLERARALVAAHQGALDTFDEDQRRLVIGISDHLVGAELPALLKRLHRAEPGLVLEMRVASSRDIVAEFDGGALDAAIVLRQDRRQRLALGVREIGRRHPGEFFLMDEFAVAPPGTVDVGPRLGLPPLGARPMMLYSSVSDPRARGTLRTLCAAIRATAG